MKKVLWLSRHAMSDEQVADLALQFGEFDVVALNVTFKAEGSEAVKQLRELFDEHRPEIVAGVFPAHIAVAFYSHREGCLPLLAMPVAIPAPAKEGEVRAFAHSHWEVW